MLLKMTSRKLCAGDVKNAHLSNASTNLRLFKVELLDYDLYVQHLKGALEYSKLLVQFQFLRPQYQTLKQEYLSMISFSPLINSFASISTNLLRCP